MRTVAGGNFSESLLAGLVATAGRCAGFVLALQALGCGGVPEEPVASESQAVNVCDETVPENRYVDGLPAYAQCDATTGSIWSNNGIDTSTSSGGSDWVRTQQGGGYQCTEWAFRYMHFRWHIDYRHGDAREWCDGTLPATLVKNTLPAHGDLIVFDGGVCGADATTGHIAVVDTVDSAKAKVTIVEENRAGRRSTDQSCATCFLHAVANDGSAGGAAGSAGAGAAGVAGNAAGAGGTPPAAGTSGTGGIEAGGRGSRGGAAGAPLGGAAGQTNTETAGAGLGGTGGADVGTAGSGGNAAAAGQATASAAGLDSAGHDDQLPPETREGVGCALRPTHGANGLGILVALLGVVARRRHGRSRARAA